MKNGIIGQTCWQNRLKSLKFKCVGIISSLETIFKEDSKMKRIICPVCGCSKYGVVTFK